MKVIRWSPIEIVEPYSATQLTNIIQNIKDIDKKAKIAHKQYFDEHGHNYYIEQEDPSLKLIEYLEKQGCKFISAFYENTEFLFSPKYTKGTYVVYTPPKTPFED